MTQEQIILNFFKDNPGRLCTPFEVHKAVLPIAPITSVRRAISNLTKKELLEKTDIKGMGVYKVENYKWRLSKGVESNVVTNQMF